MDLNNLAELSIKEELVRVRRVADMLCTGHATLRDKFKRLALSIDLSILCISTWLVAMAFADPAITVRLTPPGLSSSIWIGVLSTFVFFLSIVQLRTDWKARADAHQRTLELYAEVKREAGYVLASSDLDEVACRRVLSRYDIASAVGIELPEKLFLLLKRKHQLKVKISKYLDTFPSTSIVFLRIKWWWHDNFRGWKK